MCTSLRNRKPFSFLPLALASLSVGGCLDVDSTPTTIEARAGGTAPTVSSQASHAAGGATAAASKPEPAPSGGHPATGSDSAKPRPPAEGGSGGADSGSAQASKGGSSAAVDTSASSGGGSAQGSAATNTASNGVLLPSKTTQLRAGIPRLERTQAVYSEGYGNLAVMGLDWSADRPTEYRLFTGAGGDAREVSLNARTTDEPSYALAGTEEGWAVAYLGTDQQSGKGSELHLALVSIDGTVTKSASLGLAARPSKLSVASQSIPGPRAVTAMAYDEQLLICEDANCISRSIPSCSTIGSPPAIIGTLEGFVLARTCIEEHGELSFRWANVTQRDDFQISWKYVTLVEYNGGGGASELPTPTLSGNTFGVYALTSLGYHLFVDNQGNQVVPHAFEYVTSDATALVPRGTGFLEFHEQKVVKGDEDFVDVYMRLVEPGKPLPPWKTLDSQMWPMWHSAPSYNNETGRLTLAYGQYVADVDEANSRLENRRRIGPAAGNFIAAPRCDGSGCGVAYQFESSKPNSHGSELQMLAGGKATKVASCESCGLWPLATGEILMDEADAATLLARDGQKLWSTTKPLGSSGTLLGPIATDSASATFVNLPPSNRFAWTVERAGTMTVGLYRPEADILDCGSSWFFLKYGDRGAELYEPGAAENAAPKLTIPKASGLDPVRCAGAQIFVTEWTSQPEIVSNGALGTSVLRRFTTEGLPLPTVTVPGSLGRIAADGDTLWTLTDTTRNSKRHHLEGIRRDGSRIAVRDFELPEAADVAGFDVSEGTLLVAWETSVGLWLSSYSMK